MVVVGVKAACIINTQQGTRKNEKKANQKINILNWKNRRERPKKKKKNIHKTKRK
jgi:hypothetical protein